MSKDYARSTRILAGLLVLIQFGSLGAITLLAILSFSTSYWAVNAILIAAAGYLILTAYKSLKPSLKVNPIPKEGADFIQIGIYRKIRHPMYLAVLLYGFGAAGFSSNVAAIVISGVLALGILIKAKLEDKLLLKVHPEAWEYQMNTPGFIPCLNMRNK